MLPKFQISIVGQPPMRATVALMTGGVQQCTEWGENRDADAFPRILLG